MLELSICPPACGDSSITEANPIKMFIILHTAHINLMRLIIKDGITKKKKRCQSFYSVGQKHRAWRRWTERGARLLMAM